eukprot:2906077-Amphidinium_carterae.3
MVDEGLKLRRTIGAVTCLAWCRGNISQRPGTAKCKSTSTKQDELVASQPTTLLTRPLLPGESKT